MSDSQKSIIKFGETVKLVNGTRPAIIKKARWSATGVARAVTAPATITPRTTKCFIKTTVSNRGRHCNHERNVM